MEYARKWENMQHASLNAVRIFQKDFKVLSMPLQGIIDLFLSKSKAKPGIRQWRAKENEKGLEFPKLFERDGGSGWI